MQFRASDKLRAAVNHGAPGEAERVLAELRTEVETSWHAAKSPAERREISSEITGLLEWARRAIVVRRAHTEMRLSGLTRQGAYLAASRRPSAIEIEG